MLESKANGNPLGHVVSSFSNHSSFSTSRLVGISQEPVNAEGRPERPDGRAEEYSRRPKKLASLVRTG